MNYNNFLLRSKSIQEFEAKIEAKKQAQKDVKSHSKAQTKNVDTDSQ